MLRGIDVSSHDGWSNGMVGKSKSRKTGHDFPKSSQTAHNDALALRGGGAFCVRMGSLSPRPLDDAQLGGFFVAYPMRGEDGVLKATNWRSWRVWKRPPYFCAYYSQR